MKSVLISIQPKWCELIANGSKTVEVRKTKPKLETPFKAYIYCTANKNGTKDLLEIHGTDGKIRKANGKVIGEFVCDGFYGMCQFGFGIAIYDEQKNIIEPQDFLNWSCLTEQQVIDYIGNKDGYAWHISNLVIYDKPRELSEFRKECKLECDMRSLNEPPCEKCEHLVASFGCGRTITRPPQSWCYVEEREG